MLDAAGNADNIEARKEVDDLPAQFPGQAAAIRSVITCWQAWLAAGGRDYARAEEIDPILIGGDLDFRIAISPGDLGGPGGSDYRSTADDLRRMGPVILSAASARGWSGSRSPPLAVTISAARLCHRVVGVPALPPLLRRCRSHPVPCRSHQKTMGRAGRPPLRRFSILYRSPFLTRWRGRQVHGRPHGDEQGARHGHHPEREGPAPRRSNRKSPAMASLRSACPVPHTRFRPSARNAGDLRRS